MFDRSNVIKFHRESRKPSHKPVALTFRANDSEQERTLRCTGLWNLIRGGSKHSYLRMYLTLLTESSIDPVACCQLSLVSDSSAVRRWDVSFLHIWHVTSCLCSIVMGLMYLSKFLISHFVTFLCGEQFHYRSYLPNGLVYLDWSCSPWVQESGFTVFRL